ncbi:eight-cysteine-cluster domain-containing protein [Candidatus Nomurabacteria bacterium]|nr:eight-cysteine-cluster domain-containing protein [Candidatus Nomurabacteria bacterium]
MWKFLLVILLLISGCGILSEPNQVEQAINDVEPIIQNKDFCGTSTFGFCQQEADCIVAGCSGQICGSRFEEKMSSDCQWKECYDKTDYGLVCGCLKQKCQWYK